MKKILLLSLKRHSIRHDCNRNMKQLTMIDLLCLIGINPHVMCEYLKEVSVLLVLEVYKRLKLKR